MPPRVINVGRMSKHTWPGVLTAAAEFQPHAWVDRLDSYFVPVAEGAKFRCIDGRHHQHLDEASLGPQAPGGAAGSALTYRLGEPQDALGNATYVTDAHAMIERYLELGLPPGGHRDDGEHPESVGCGAIDSLPKVLDNLTDPRLVRDHERLTRALMLRRFHRDTYLRMLGAALVLRSRSDDYFAGRGAVLDLLEQRSPGSVVTLSGDHRESVAIVNLVQGTTLSSNRFADDAGVQAFGYDLWWTLDVAGLLFPEPEQTIERRRFLHGRVMFTVAVLMTLTDGSLPLLIQLS